MNFDHHRPAHPETEKQMQRAFDAGYIADHAYDNPHDRDRAPRRYAAWLAGFEKDSVITICP